MKTLRAFYTFAVCISILCQASAQCGNTAIEHLQANQIKALFSNAGDLFSDGQFDGGFAVPYKPGEPEVHTFLTGSLIVAGIDPNGSVRASTVGYRSDNSRTDFVSGPLQDITGQPFENGCSDFDHIWQVYRYEILQLLQDFEADGRINKPIPYNIRTWPGRGNPYFREAMGFDLPDQDLAPFFDRNNNGLYEPNHGEYPIIGANLPEAIPDHLLWAVFNDVGNSHPYTGSEPIGLEIHLMAYGFNCSENESVNQSIFTRHKVILKGAEPMTDLIAGFWFDPDLGCYTDDYIGTDTTLNAVYFYNQDPIDGLEDCLCPNEVNSYCEMPPVQSIKVLNQPLWRSMVFANGGVGSFPPGMTDPIHPIEYYNYLQGYWRDGKPLTPEAFGYNSDTPDEVTRFAFYDDPNDPDGWSMYAENLPTLDSRSIFSAQPQSLEQGAVLIIDLAFSFHQDPGASHLENVHVMQAELPAIQDLYDTGFAAVCTQLEACDSDCVWPGDADHSGRVDKDDLLAVGVAVGQSASGARRSINFFDWIPQTVADWPMAFPNRPNYKHADCNGDGMVFPIDRVLIDLHYGQTVPGYKAPEDQVPLRTDFELRLENNTDEISSRAPYNLPRTLRTKIFLGTETRPVEGIYGIGFTVLFDPELMELPANFPVIRDIFEDLLGEDSENISIVHPDIEAGRIDFSICKTDGQPVDVFGEVGEFWLQLRRDARTPNPDSTAQIIYKIVNLKAIDQEGNLLDIGAKGDTTLATHLIFDPIPQVDDLPVGPDYFIVSPNPSQGTLFLELINPKKDEEVELRLLNLQSQVLMERRLFFRGSGIQVDLPTGLNSGLYLVVLDMEDGRRFVHRVVVG